MRPSWSTTRPCGRWRPTLGAFRKAKGSGRGANFATASRVYRTYLFSAEGPCAALLAPRDAAGASCRLVAWMAWLESIGTGSSTVDMVYDESNSPRGRHSSRCLPVDGEGPVRALTALSRVDGCGDAHEVVPAAPWPALGWYLMAQAKERAPAALLVVLTVLTACAASLEALAG